jgi:hypothetical protein
VASVLITVIVGACVAWAYVQTRPSSFIAPEAAIPTTDLRENERMRDTSATG